MQMTDSQKANMMEARVAYIKKIGELLLERQELRIKLQVHNLALTHIIIAASVLLQSS